MTRRRQLTDVIQAFNALGGNKAVQELTGAGKTTVWWWRKNRRFPSRYYVVLSRALLDRGYDPAASMWGQVDA